MRLLWKPVSLAGKLCFPISGLIALTRTSHYRAWTFVVEQYTPLFCLDVVHILLHL